MASYLKTIRHDEDVQIRAYAEYLANRYDMKVDSFDFESAAAGYDDIRSEISTVPSSLASSGKSSENASNPTSSAGSALTQASSPSSCSVENSVSSSKFKI